MIRATEVLPAGKWDRTHEADTIELPHDGRHQRKIAMRGSNDTVFMLDLAEAALLQDGDGVKLEDGRIVRIVAASEPLIEVSGSAEVLARIAWYLGNSHLAAQFLPDRILTLRDRGVEEGAAALGAKVAKVEAPFEPEGGGHAGAAAHADGHHDHRDHHRHHHHDHHHEHGPDCGCGHDGHHHHHGHKA